MTAPLDLADEIDALIARAADSRKPVTHTIRGEDGWMIAAALRLAEANCAYIDQEDDQPLYPKPGEMQKWSDERDVLIGRFRDAEDAYRKARGA